MGDITFTCRDHGPLVPDPDHPGILRCPEEYCGSSFRPGPAFPGAMPPSPLTTLAQTAAAHHEFVVTYVAAGFTRAEAMQLLTGVLQATVMKGAGGG